MTLESRQRSVGHIGLPCPGGSESCPGHDGDPCNYEDHGDTKAMPVPAGFQWRVLWPGGEISLCPNEASARELAGFGGGGGNVQRRRVGPWGAPGP